MRAILPCITLFFATFAWLDAAHAIAKSTNFTLHAKFFPGGGGELADPEILARALKPWELRIERDGKAIQDIFMPVIRRDEITNKRIRKTQTLSPSVMQGLLKSIIDADFFVLPRSLTTGEYEHRAGIVIRITIEGRTHEVSFVAPAEKIDKRAFGRFWQVWRALARSVPSPNGNQEMIYWLRNAHPDLPRTI
jgi:hypothetical protein